MLKLTNIEIQKHNGDKANLSRKQKNQANPYKLVVLFAVIAGVLSWGAYKYYQINNKTSDQPNQKTTDSKPLRYQGAKVTAQNNLNKYCSNNNYKNPTSIQSNNGKIYYWTDKKGVVHATNTDIPVNINSVKSINEKNPFNKRTPIKINGGSINIPVTFTNNGITITTEMVIDTGCTTTLINTELARRLKLKKTNNKRFTVADGRTVYGESGKIDSLKVGPYTENNIEIAYQKHAGAANSGLLGMNFLKKHPFSIDIKNKAIIWQ